MIKLQELTPDIYYKQSRDFQYIGRLYDLVLNSVKTNTELIYNAPFSDNVDSKWIDLLTLTLGFKSKHNYNIKQLTALCSAFMTIIKNKGNINSILLAGQTLINAEGITEEFKCNISPDNDHLIEVYIPEKFSDTSLLRDLLNYILPAGMQVRFINEVLSFKQDVETALITSDAIDLYVKEDSSTAIIPQIINSYNLLEAQPANWANWYQLYYRTNDDKTFEKIPEFAGADDWPFESSKYDYYSLRNNNFELLTVEPADWKTTYFNYYYKYKNADVDEYLITSSEDIDEFVTTESDECIITTNLNEYIPIPKAPLFKNNNYSYYEFNNITEPRARANAGLFINSTVIRTPNKSKEENN